MTVLRFTRGDALRCRFGASPLWETMSAVRVLNGSRHRPLYRDWVEARREAASRLDLRGLKALQPRVGFTPDFLTPPPKASRAKFATEIARVRSTPLDRVRTELIRSRDELDNPAAPAIDTMLQDLAGTRERLADEIESAWETLIKPDWPLIGRVLEDDIAHRGQQLTHGGLAGLFDDPHPTLTWDDDRLIPTPHRPEDRDLAGQGLLPLPEDGSGAGKGWSCARGSWLSRSGVSAGGPAAPPAPFPARGGPPRRWSDPPPPPAPLAPPLGRPRASLLVPPDPPATTSAL